MEELDSGTMEELDSGSLDSEEFVVLGAEVESPHATKRTAHAVRAKNNFFTVISFLFLVGHYSNLFEYYCPNRLQKEHFWQNGCRSSCFSNPSRILRAAGEQRISGRLWSAMFPRAICPL